MADGGHGWTSRPEVIQTDGPIDHIIIEGEDEVSQRLCAGCVRCVRETGGPGVVDPLLVGLGGVRTSRWSYVGLGQGRFDKWQSYSYVGSGAGEFEKEIATSGPSSWRLKKPLWLPVLLLLAPLLAYLIFVAVQRDEAETTQREQRAVIAPAASTSAMPTEAFRCLEGVDWTALEEDFCCRSPGGRCTTTPAPRLGVDVSKKFDCKLGLSNWRLSWPEKKKLWCCRHSRVGCLPGMPTPPPEKKKPAAKTEEPEEAPKAASKAPSPAPPAPRHSEPTFAPPVHSAQRATMAPFNCQEGLSEFGGLWRREKKEWCCKHEHLGCPTTAQSTTEKPRASTTARRRSCEEEAGEEGREWSKERRSWCCKHEKRGCEKKSYDCLQSYFNWVVAWSENKRRWCCKHEDRACKSP